MKSPAKRTVYEIRIAHVRVGAAAYPRPCIVVEYEPGDKARVLLLSTKDYSERGQTFCIDAQHPDFAATGLKATSFTIHPPEYVPAEFLKSKRGELRGDLAAAFREWIGD